MENDTKLKPRTYVSRSVYQRVVEQNRKLLADIKLLCDTPNPESLKLRIEWRNKFKAESDFNDMMKKVAIEYFKEHPEERLQVPGYNYCDRCGHPFKSNDPEMKICPSCY